METTDPTQPTKLLRLPVVKDRTGLSKPSIYRLMKEGRFPKSIKISERAIGWLETDIEAFIQSRLAA